MAGIRFQGSRAALLCCCLAVSAFSAEDTGSREFAERCAGCHGLDGGGGERGPALGGGRRRGRSESEIRQVLRNGIPEGGMPGFRLPPAQEDALVGFVRRLTAPAADHPVAGDAAAGERFFRGQGGCARCHMMQGHGGVLGPDLSDVARRRTLAQIRQALAEPGLVPLAGYRPATVRLAGGGELRGLIRNESNYDLQLMDLDGRLHRLPRSRVAEIVREKASLMPPLRAGESEQRDLLAYLTRPGPVVGSKTPIAPVAWSAGDWPTYHGDFGGNRHSPLRQIDRRNVARLAPRWIFPMRGARRLEVTPVVVDGIMYVTAANEAYALDASTGREIWHYARPLTPGLVGDAAGAINRGVAVLGDRLFMVTDNARLLALDRRNGGLIWDVEMADYRQHYGATSAPLVVNDLVVSGTSGGDEGVRGFVAAYKASTGERVWRFWTAPAPGEPLAETWKGRAIEHPCASTWLTGTYDAGNDLLYWTVGNPCPDYNGDERKGDNLYSDSVVALRPATGELVWYYQFTPHDLHDWDAQQTPMLIDAEFQGRRRQLLAQANRNGFFYVLDRLTGKLLLAEPFVKKLTWAAGIGPDGRPRTVPGTEPSIAGTRVCPAVEGATNWFSTAWHPETGLFYVMALERCQIYTKSAAWWEPGKSFYGGGTRDIPGEPGQKLLRAIDLKTGKIAWEYPQAGPANSWGGVLSTAGGLVFFGDDSGAFAAVDAQSGEPLWHFHTSHQWKASPMTYLADGRQYVAVAAGSDIVAFALTGSDPASAPLARPRPRK